MAQRDDKRRQRQLKRDIKRAGNKRRRQRLKQDLDRDPEEAAHSEPDLGRYSTESLNGQDDDATRRRDQPPDDPVE
jgi:hypothetical protein